MMDRTKIFLKKRDRLSIYLSILDAIRECSITSKTGYAKFTHIMYKSNLSSQRLKERLKELSYLDLIIWNDLGIKLTSKGIKFLDDFKKLMTTIDSYIKPLNK